MEVRNDLGAAPLAIARLEALRAELARRGLESELVTSGSWPRLRLKIPGTFGDAFDDNVVAAESGGRWMFWWPGIELIGPAADPAGAAEIIADELGADMPARGRRVW